jgi:hypothetical protein
VGWSSIRKAANCAAQAHTPTLPSSSPAAAKCRVQRVKSQLQYARVQRVKNQPEGTQGFSTSGLIAYATHNPQYSPQQKRPKDGARDVLMQARCKHTQGYHNHPHSTIACAHKLNRSPS